MKSEPVTIYLRDYHPPEYNVDHLELYFDLHEDHTTVIASMLLRRNSTAAQTGNASGSVKLQGESDLKLVRIDGEPVSQSRYRRGEDGLEIFRVPDIFLLTLVTVIEPQNNTSLMGLYKSSGNFCTQCEAEGFRKMTYFPDRPDVLCTYTTTIEADKNKYPVLLSNGNLVASGERGENRHWVRWHDPFPKPSYLFALVAGDLACIKDKFKTKSGRKVDIRFYTQHHNADQCGHAVASLKKAMAWDEKVYGREYDLDIYMVVAVDDFNMGAMENKGLNVFNSKYVLAKPQTATDTDYQHIEGVIGHEYFHNWSGNRVTCRDWFQLSLKEGFTVFRDQEFSADMGSRGVKRIADVNVLRSHQFREDQGPMAHPVRPSSYVEINNFYTMTVYNKGAEVVRMLHYLTGKEGFRKGTDLYFDRHDGQAVTTDDFVKAMEDANNMDLSQFMHWYTQAGTPKLTLNGHYNSMERTYTLKVEQSCPPTPGQKDKSPFHIPLAVGLIDPDGKQVKLQLQSDEKSVGHTYVLHVKAQRETFVFKNIDREPVPSLLRGFSAPVRVVSNLSDEQRSFLAAHDSDPFNRWESIQQLAINALKPAMREEQETVQAEMLIGAMRRILETDHEDRAMAAELLSLPSETYLSEFVDKVDPERIHHARLALKKTIAAELRDLLLQTYTDNRDPQYRNDGASIGRRRLKNTCLDYLMELEDSQYYQLAYEQFQQADNMTDQLAALHVLCEHECPQRQPALDAFYEQWRHDALVMDKWLSIQAISRLPRTLEKVKALENHPVFSIKNPNKVRALIGAFSIANQAQFHQADGSGYAYLADKILELDRLNPQVAARLLNVFSHWRSYDPQRQQSIRGQLQRIYNSNPSKDVYEIAQKSLNVT